MNRHDHQRRIILRGTLAVGAGMILAACDSRQSTSATATASTTRTNSATVIAQSAKLSQEQVQYQGTPNGEQQCGNCRHFVAESNACNMVEGHIDPEGWCIIWAE